MFRRATLVCAVAVAFTLTGCDRVKVEGRYQDAENPAITYVFTRDGAWRAEEVLGVAAGVFPHGSGRRLEGTFGRRGDTLDLKCTTVSRQEPMTGEFCAESVDASAYSHLLRLESGALVPVAPGQTKGTVFPSDINPLGARKLVPAGG